MGHKCAICDVDLTQEDLSHYSTMDFFRTCKTHHQYSQCFQEEVIKKKLGFISEYSNRLKKCCICHNDLSKDEQDTIEESDFNVTCASHREVKSIFQLHIATQWFEYKKEHPMSILKNENDRRDFNIWRQENNKG